jgi:hypothetical protein
MSTFYKGVYFNSHITINFIDYEYERQSLDYLNNIRFKIRIKTVEDILNPILNIQHRNRIYNERFSCHHLAFNPV